MKKYFILSILLILMSMFYSCKSDLSYNDKSDLSQVQKMNKALPEFSQQLGINSKGVIVIDMKTGSTKNAIQRLKMLRVKSNDSLDIDKAIEVKFLTENRDTLTSITVPLKNNPNRLNCIIDYQGELCTVVVDFDFDENNLSFSYQLPNRENPLNNIRYKVISSWGTRWMDCMKKVMSSHVGVIIDAAAIAGGLGCVPCSGVAGFYFGVAVIGCSGNS